MPIYATSVPKNQVFSQIGMGTGNSLVVQWLGLSAFTPVARAWSLVGELRSHKPRDEAKKQNKTKQNKGMGTVSNCNALSLCGLQYQWPSGQTFKGTHTPRCCHSDSFWLLLHLPYAHHFPSTFSCGTCEWSCSPYHKPPWAEGLHLCVDTMPPISASHSWCLLTLSASPTARWS